MFLCSCSSYLTCKSNFYLLYYIVIYGLSDPTIMRHIIFSSVDYLTLPSFAILYCYLWTV